MWSYFALGEEKPKNTIGHVGDEARDSTAFADESGRGTVAPRREVVFVILWCIREDTHSFFRLVKANSDTIFWNAGKINPNVHVLILQHLELHEPFWSILQKLVVYCVKPFCSFKTKKKDGIFRKLKWVKKEM